jgi:hypothetical protein
MQSNGAIEMALNISATMRNLKQTQSHMHDIRAVASIGLSVAALPMHKLGQVS